MFLCVLNVLYLKYIIVKKIIFVKFSKYDNELNYLPKSVEFIQLPQSYDKKIYNIPLSLRKVIFSLKYPFINDFVLNIIDIKVYRIQL